MTLYPAPVGEPAKPSRLRRGDYGFETRREYKKAWSSNGSRFRNLTPKIKVRSLSGLQPLALLRNLRNIAEQAPELAQEVAAQLTDRRRIKQSLVLPF